VLTPAVSGTPLVISASAALNAAPV